MPAARCLATCVAVLLSATITEGLSVAPQAHDQLEAGFPWHTVTPAWLSRIRGDRKSDALAALAQNHEVKEKAVPPEGIETVNHQKAKGDGYSFGSPLYHRQEAIMNGTLVAHVTKTEPHDPGSPSGMAAFILLGLALACVAGVTAWNQQASKGQARNLEPDFAKGVLPPTGSSLRSPSPIGTQTVVHGPGSRTQLHAQQPMSMHQQQQIHSSPHHPAHLSAQPQMPLHVQTSPPPRHVSAGGPNSSPHLQATHIPHSMVQPPSPTHSSPSRTTYPTIAHVSSPAHSQASHGPPVGFHVSPRSGHLTQTQSMPPGSFEHVQIVDPSVAHGSWQSLPAHAVASPHSRPGN